MFQTFLLRFKTGESSLDVLPVEMVALIFRYLDPASLMKAAKVCSRWMDICRGDPVLRRRLRMQLKEEEKMRRELMVNPGLAVEVQRVTEEKMFHPNAVKIVKRLNLPEFPVLTKKVDGRKNKRATEVRKTPYRKGIRI